MDTASFKAGLRRTIAVVALVSALRAVGAEPPANSFTLDAWTFERGNARTFIDDWADAGPMIAYGGSSPVVVEYDFDLPSTGDWTLHLNYAAANARPVKVFIDGKPLGEGCRAATGGWNTSQAKWEATARFSAVADRHTLKLERAGDFPHIVGLRFAAAAPLPAGWKPHRPAARKLESPPSQLAGRVDPVALRLAIEDLIATFGEKYPNGREYLRQLEKLEREPAGESPLRALAREALLANPLLDCDRVLLVHRKTHAPARSAEGRSLGAGASNWSTADNLPRQGEFEDTLAILSELRGEPKIVPLFRPANGETLIDPVLHFDADRVVFAMNGAKEKNWRLWELRFGEDAPHQITPDHGADVGHFDPCYLPDGRIIFASTAAYQGLPCVFGSDFMTCLYQFDPKTRQTRQITFEQDSDWCPTLLPNGRVMYLRWEYTDQSHANSRILFHMNPDGTDQREFRGSGSWFPGSFFYAKAIPGEAHQIIGIASGHHGTARSGRLLILDPSRGRRDAEGIVQEIPGRGKPVEPIVRDRLVDGVWPQFLMPAPLSAKYHLVTAKLGPNSLWGLYLVDVFDNVTLIKEVEGAALLWPAPVLRRERPPVIQDRVKPETDECTVFVADVNEGPGLQGIPRGTVKTLRIIEYYFARRGMGGLYGTLGADGPWDIKRILGTVPVEPDGSAQFVMPANTPVCVQPLDAQGQALQLERSWFVGMPGERVSCIGCHESQDAAAVSRSTAAMRRAPSRIDDWFGPARGFSFEREVQPVLDRHCVGCHDGSAQAAAPSLQGGQPLKDWKTQLSGHWPGGGKFTVSYWELQRCVRRPGIEGDRRMFTPMDYHFSTTELGQLLRKGHHGVALDAEGHERLTAWADLNAPFYGTWGEIPPFTSGYGHLNGEQVVSAGARALELRRQFVPMGPFPDYEKIPETPRYGEAAPPMAQNSKPAHAPTPVGVEAPHRAPGVEADAAKQTTVTLAPGVTLELVCVPGGRFLMGSTRGHADETPTAEVAVKSFWMARFETSNRQFRQFDSAHESRTEDRHGYQFGAVGYDQDLPDQPAVRVSWEEAMAFCRWLSHRTGSRFTLPTEAQWEWACRAGSAKPFSFGAIDADYSRHANLADRRLRDFAADTSLDHYAAQRPMKNPNRFDDWLPRDDRYDDGGFVTASAGQYEPNAWALHDMHGNAAEWTLSAYRPYPYRDDDGRNAIEGAARDTERVVRGGSWRDRPFRATSSYRIPYRQYQRVFNVGFRIVCEGGITNPGGEKLSADRRETP
ncbi:MAG: SUMF1/EgtB/PvdO family nonheme iron enzyme [Verrucomicrobiales bacterium]|nr:SUMF1/EgtB/PvdO family nonheme iron enzyme [Verrucomicrobiales bacterium]